MVAAAGDTMVLWHNTRKKGNKMGYDSSATTTTQIEILDLVCLNLGDWVVYCPQHICIFEFKKRKYRGHRANISHIELRNYDNGWSETAIKIRFEDGFEITIDEPYLEGIRWDIVPDRMENNR